MSDVRFSLNGFNRSASLDVDPDLEGSIRAAAEAGFDHFGPDRFSLARYDLAEVASWFVEYGISCYELVPLPIGRRADTTPVLDTMLRQADVIGAQHVLAGVRGPVSEETVDVCGECVDRFAALGLPIAIEHVPWADVSSLAQTLALIEAVGRPTLGVMVDTWHFFRGPDTWTDLEALSGDQVGFVQFDDAPALESDDLYAETLHRRLFPGEGEFDLARFCSVMADKGFAGVVSVEVLSADWRDRPLDEFARRALDASRPYWVSASG